MHHQAHTQQLSVDIQSSRTSHELSRVSKRRPAQERFSSSRKHASTRGHTNRSIRVTNDFGDKDALLLLLDQHGRHLIEKMAFCMRPKALPADEALDAANGCALSAAARDLLSGRLTGPNLRRVDVECGLELLDAAGDHSTTAGAFEREVNRAFGPPRDEEALLRLEAEDPRRRLLAEAWAALAQNATVRELAVDRLVPAWTSAFHSAAFRALLGRLEALRVGVFGARRGPRGINTAAAYVDALQSVLKALFLHAGGLRRLSLHASPHAPLGGRGPYRVPLCLKATLLPRLRHLSLAHCFVGFELAHFVNAHAGTLETLRLRNCYAHRGAGEPEGDGAMTWATFLATITRAPGPATATATAAAAAAATRLRRLEVLDDHIPLEAGDARLRDYDPDAADEPEDVRGVRRAQRADPRRRLFLYAHLRDYSGELWMNKEAILASFDAGDDQRAYDALMAVVRANADAYGGGGGEGGGGEGLVPEEKGSAVGGSVEEVVELPA